jgi:hypothetical protein
MEHQKNTEPTATSARAKRKIQLDAKDRYIRPAKRCNTKSKKATPSSSISTPITHTPLVEITNIQTTPINSTTTQPQPSQLNAKGKHKSCAPNPSTTINLINKFSAAVPGFASTSYLPNTVQPPTNSSHDDNQISVQVSDAAHHDCHDNEVNDDCDSNFDENDDEILSSDSDSDMQQGEDNFQIGNITFRGLYIYLMNLFTGFNFY